MQLHRHRVSNFWCEIRLYSWDCLHVQLPLLQPHAFLLYFRWGVPGEKCAIPHWLLFPSKDVPTFQMDETTSSVECWIETPHRNPTKISTKSWFLKGSRTSPSFKPFLSTTFSSKSQMVPNKSLSAPPKKETDLYMNSVSLLPTWKMGQQFLSDYRMCG